jgi:hypothetical protein
MHHAPRTLSFAFALGGQSILHLSHVPAQTLTVLLWTFSALILKTPKKEKSQTSKDHNSQHPRYWEGARKNFHVSPESEAWPVLSTTVSVHSAC